MQVVLSPNLPAAFRKQAQGKEEKALRSIRLAQADKYVGPSLLPACCVSFIKLLPFSDPYLLHLWLTGHLS